MSKIIPNPGKGSTDAAPGDLVYREQIAATIGEVLDSSKFIDIHTHLYPPAFGKLGLWGIDELLTYQQQVGQRIELRHRRQDRTLAAILGGMKLGRTELLRTTATGSITWPRSF